VHGIKYHHDPLSSPLQYKDVVFCVYLANAFTGIERDLITFEQIERPVLSDFRIAGEEQARAILDRLQKSFERRQATF
jgi:hypothetical protein